MPGIEPVWAGSGRNCMSQYQNAGGVIGGMFALHEPTEKRLEARFYSRSGIPAASSPLPSPGAESVFLANARSGIALLVETLSPPQVWLPSFLCSTMVEPSGRGSSRVRFYEIDYDLEMASHDWMSEICEGDLVIMIAYFGVPVNALSITRVKSRGAWVLEDACQAMLSQGVGQRGDFVLFSPRKIMGVPDGGILCAKEPLDWDRQLQPAPKQWQLQCLAASLQRRDFDNGCGGSHWYQTYKAVDETHPCGRYAMSELSLALLQNCIDFEEIARRRVENFRCLQGRLADYALIPELPAGVVPHGFPVRLRQRDRVKEGLCAQKIFPPVHWPISGIVPESFSESHRLAGDLMTLPCDQRYGPEEMLRMAEAVLTLNQC
ncbi:MAG: DegT/DnrJ/EryC1/StrS family aminotransferase [Verrucomicrobiota bacterium]